MPWHRSQSLKCRTATSPGECRTPNAHIEENEDSVKTVSSEGKVIDQRGSFCKATFSSLQFRGPTGSTSIILTAPPSVPRKPFLPSCLLCELSLSKHPFLPVILQWLPLLFINVRLEEKEKTWKGAEIQPSKQKPLFVHRGICANPQNLGNWGTRIKSSRQAGLHDKILSQNKNPY